MPTSKWLYKIQLTSKTLILIVLAQQMPTTLSSVPKILNLNVRQMKKIIAFLKLVHMLSDT